MGNTTNRRRLAWNFALLCLGIGTFCLALAGSADGQEKKKPQKLTDAEITQLLSGKWSMQTDLKTIAPTLKDPPDVKLTILFHHKKDGTFEVAITAVADQVTTRESMEGTWKVAEGILEKTLTKVNSPSNPKLKAGETSKERIISINAMTLTLLDLKEQPGEKMKPLTFKRVKE